MKKLIYYKDRDRWIVQLENSKPFPESPCLITVSEQEIKQLDDIYDILSDAVELFRMKEKELETKETEADM